MEAAGYDRLSNLASASGEVGTGGLANCIAVVGFDISNRMAIAHYNTINCMDTSSNPVRWNEASLTNFREWFKKQRQATKFMVGLGKGWIDPGGDMDRLRIELIQLIIKVFGYEPTVAGYCITCRERTLISHANNDVMPKDWDKTGLQIPYDQLKGR
ncbi:hypothetical protein [Pseudomonas chlororaphis]|uniref:hypothetical protein n=1 Tax=Pseudomonas chlororaphis TaxID=587753 RepID=UPI0039E1D3E8